MQSLFNLKKSSLTTAAIAGCMVAFTGGASANSVTLSLGLGMPFGRAGTISSPYFTTSAFTVTVFANLTGLPTGCVPPSCVGQEAVLRRPSLR